jgi:hypothetical protein
MATKHIKYVINEKRQCFNDVNFREIFHLLESDWGGGSQKKVSPFPKQDKIRQTYLIVSVCMVQTIELIC